MLRIVAAAALSLFVTLACSDALCCPDGCTYEAQGDHHDAAPADCVFCAAAMTPVAPVMVAGPCVLIPPPPIDFLDLTGWRRDPPVPPPRSLS